MSCDICPLCGEIPHLVRSQSRILATVIGWCGRMTTSTGRT